MECKQFVRGAGVWCCAAVLSACTALIDEPPSAGVAGAPFVACMPAGDGVVPVGLKAASDFQRVVEAGPLFAAAGGGSGVASCTMRRERSSVELRYRFRNGGSLRATRDASIEFVEQQAGLSAPLDEEPTLVLARAELWTFGEEGCGIDWSRRETMPAEGGAVDTVSRGNVCQCQARVRRDAQGRVMRLTISSAC
jgi:hypothetical protein